MLGIPPQKLHYQEEFLKFLLTSYNYNASGGRWEREVLYKSEVMSLLVDSEWQFLPPSPSNHL